MLANFLSGLRVLLVPLLFHLISQGDAILLFTAATDLGDGLGDGLVARHFGQTSRLGKILDPLAD